MIPFLIGLLTGLGAFFRSRYNLGLEILALRQQLGVLKRKHPRVRLRIQDRIFWTLLRRLWPAWTHVLVIVKPETVVAWHRAGFQLFWRLRSRPRSLGRPKIDREVRDLIRQMVNENPSWGAPRIHGELLKLGLNVSERTVSRYLRRRSPSDDARQLWSAFLRNHRDVIAAMDFFTVPTLTFRVLYVLLFRYRTWPTQDSPFQCHGTPEWLLDSATTQGGIPGLLSLPVRDSGA
jgi:putative transposase